MKRIRLALIALVTLGLGLLAIPVTQAVVEEKTTKPQNHQLITNLQDPENLKQEPKEPEYVKGELIVKLKEGATLESLKELNEKYKVTSIEKVFKDTPDPEETLKQLKDTLANLNPKHEGWYWQLDKESQEYKEYIQRIEKEKEGLTKQIQAQEELVAHLEQRQKRAPEGATTPNLENIYLLKTEDQETEIPLMASAYKTNPAVEYAEPNYIATVQMLPNDPYYFSSNSWGQGYDDLWGLKKIQAEQAWDISQGEGVVVAVIDTGIDYNHEDIAENIWTNAGEIAGNGIDDDGNGFVDDVKGWDHTTCAQFNSNGCVVPKQEDNDPIDGQGHGTHCAGTVAAIGNNSKGIIGVAPKAKVMAVKGLNDYGQGSDTDLAKAIRYAADNGADVLSNSWGPKVPIASNATAEAAIDYAYAKGCVIVFAAGNNNDDVSYYSPANYPKVITAAASDQNDQKCYFSNYGTKIDVAAPGGNGSSNPYNILSLLSGTHSIGLDGYIVGSLYLRLGGTSMACPHVAGEAALILSKQSNFSNEEVRHAIRISADDIGGAGFDKLYGYGRINISKAVNISSVCIADITAPQNNSYIKGQVEIRGSAYGINFKQYSVAYKFQSSSTWQTITTSTSTITEGILCLWEINQLPDDFYYVRLSVEDTSGKQFQEHIGVYVDKRLEDSWPVEVFSWMTSPIIADIDNDGDKEIAVKTFDGSSILLLNHDGTKLNGWPEYISQFGTIDVGGPVVLADLDNDNDLEIIFTTYSKKIVVLHHNGTLLSGWPVELQGDFGENKPLIVDDLDQDGKNEVILLIKDYLYVCDSQGKIFSGWPIPVSRNWTNLRALATGDVNNDGRKEIVMGAFDKIYVYRLDGTIVNNWPQQLDKEVHFIALGDVDKDGKLEIFATAWSSDKVYAFKSDGTNIPNWPKNTGGATLWSIALADINNDGYLEIFSGLALGSGKKVYAWNYSGVVLSGWPITLPIVGNQENSWGNCGVSGISIADIDGNGTAEIIIQPRVNEIYAYNAAGNIVSGFPLRAIYHESDTNSTLVPAIGDIDNDKKNEIIAVFLGYWIGPSISRIYAWEMPEIINSNARILQWPMYGHDSQQTSNYNHDPTPPTTPVVTDSGAYTDSTTQLTASWVSSDPDSGITEYQYKITQGFTSGLVIQDWTPVGTATTVTATDLVLTQGKTYYFSVKAWNGAGVESEIGYSDGIKCDTTRPITPTVYDQGTYTKNTSSLSAHWSTSDPESGIAESEYKVTRDSTTGVVIRDWTSTGSMRSVTATGLNLLHGRTYYIAVKVKNGAGLESEVGWSDGIKVDTTPPSKPSINDFGVYTTSTTTLKAKWSSSDWQSGIVEYQYKINSDSPTGPVVRSWVSVGTVTSVTINDLALEHNKTYYFSVKAKNGAGLWSAIGSSNGIKVDTTPPLVPIVTDEGATTASTTTLSASWSSSDPESGITTYKYKITVGSPTGTTIKGWTISSTPSVTVTGLTLVKGKTYYFSVKAKNGALLWSAIGCSDGIKVE